MTDELEPVSGKSGISRREALRRGAIAGGAIVWASPVVQTIGMRKAYAQTTPAVTDISFIALLLECGSTTYRIKWETDFTGAPDECGNSFSIGDCPPGDLPAGSTSACPADVSASVNPNGSVTVTFPASCNITDFVVKRGQCCAGPGAAGEPSTPIGGGSATFPIPSTNGPC